MRQKAFFIIFKGLSKAKNCLRPETAPLNKAEIKKYSLPSLMENPDLGATATNFIVVLQSIDYSKFDRFSKVADEISTKLLSSFLECEVLVAVPDRYDFKFSVKAAERERQTEDSTHMQEIEIIANQKFPKLFQSYLRTLKNSNNKANLVK